VTPDTAQDELRVVIEVIIAGSGPDHPGVTDIACEITATLSYSQVDAKSHSEAAGPDR